MRHCPHATDAWLSTTGRCPTPIACVDARRRDVDLVVIHCTELPDLAIAREYGERVLHDNGSGNSGHFYIDRDGGDLSLCRS